MYVLRKLVTIHFSFHVKLERYRIHGDQNYMRPVVVIYDSNIECNR
jgi:hypothetical protein